MCISAHLNLTVKFSSEIYDLYLRFVKSIAEKVDGHLGGSVS